MSSVTLALDRAAAHLAHARELRAALSSLFAESAELQKRSRQLCLFRRRMTGGSDLDAPSETAGEGAEPRRAAATQAPGLWRFLESRRGEMFCSRCLAVALSATKRIDRAIFWAEGRGARRLHGPCASCGRDRLLCGLTR
jgi:hypothetical protein